MPHWTIRVRADSLGSAEGNAAHLNKIGQSTEAATKKAPGKMPEAVI